VDIRVKAPRFYRAELDALRFLAFLSVFLFHTLPLAIPAARPWMYPFFQAGRFGMCLFYCLSAYLITELLRDERALTGSIHLPWFYVRRVLRIWPLYFAVLALGYGLGAVHGSLRVSGGALAAYLLLAGNWYLVFLKAPFGSPAGPLWSVSLEEQFYLFWPAIMRWCSTKTARRLAMATLIVSPVVVSVLAALRTEETWPYSIWVNSFTQVQYFGIGALIAISLQGRMPAFQARTRMFLLASAAAFWLLGGLGFTSLEQWNHPSIWRETLTYEAGGAGALCLLLAVLGVDGSAVPGSFAYLGKISYGLYAFHSFSISATHLGPVRTLESRLPQSVAAPLLHCVLPFTLTVAAAAASYRLLETPFLKLKERFAFVKSRPV
jgi:peptidoglycan/LPS O-acetylase OafA/YrhL